MGRSPSVSVELYLQYRAVFPLLKILEIPNVFEPIHEYCSGDKYNRLSMQIESYFSTSLVQPGQSKEFGKTHANATVAIKLDVIDRSLR